MKHKYDASEIVETESFDLDSYITYENQRFVKSKNKKSESFLNISKIHQIIIDRKFTEICELTDYIHENVPELCECLYDNFYSFRSYIDSRTNLHRLKNQLIERIDRLEKDNQYLRKELDDERESSKALRDQDLKLRKYICELGGDVQKPLMHLGIYDYETLDSD